MAMRDKYCLVMGLLVPGSSGNEDGQTDLAQVVSFPDSSLYEGGALLRATVADLVRRMSEMENIARPQEDMIEQLRGRVSTLEAQLTMEQTIRAELEGRVNISVHQGDLARQLKTELCSTTPKLGRLFPKRSPAGRYKYDLDEARHACAEQGATLASYHQLYEAWQDGLDWCKCGWLSDGTARYPTQSARPGCGAVGINTCGGASSYDAWCFHTMSACD